MFVLKLTAHNTHAILRVEDDECIRYPYVDKRQGKFPGRQHFNAAETMTGSYPDEKEFRFKECLSMINKIKYAVKKSKHNIWELREAYKTLDQVNGYLVRTKR